MLRLTNLKIGLRIQLIVALSILGMLVLQAADLMKIRAELIEDRKVKTRHLVESAHTLIAYFDAQAKAGTISEEEAKNAAKAAIKALGYDKKEYFWINDMTPRMVMHPYKPALDGKDLSGFKDPAGKLFLCNSPTRSRQRAPVLSITNGRNPVPRSRSTRFHTSRDTNPGGGLSARVSISMTSRQFL